MELAYCPIRRTFDWLLTVMPILLAFTFQLMFKFLAQESAEAEKTSVGGQNPEEVEKLKAGIFMPGSRFHQYVPRLKNDALVAISFVGQQISEFANQQNTAHVSLIRC